MTIAHWFGIAFGVLLFGGLALAVLGGVIYAVRQYHAKPKPPAPVEVPKPSDLEAEIASTFAHLRAAQKDAADRTEAARKAAALLADGVSKGDWLLEAPK